MIISTQIIQSIFNNIERADINENMENLIEDDIIDSMDMMKLIIEIEKTFNKPLNSKYITPDNFKNFQSIKNMLQEAMT
ncbi:TPA: acyl carrier protein [Campylobacter coli]|nr:acyl carrier protein [Campylobacter coli]EEW9939399.1 acyl carrier protein [Campylobacter jejuni]ELK4667140.1 acyl carrier protein [Campylobacter coli]HEA8164833.1 acyl carrier protein [Campylobacter coli]HEH5121165.1 acyl carrier protein [Campylobacter coli]